MLWRSRLGVIMVLLLIMVAALLWRLFDMTVMERDFLLKQGQQRFVRVVSEHGYRGMILDRNGEPLAVSTAMASVWVNPQLLTLTASSLSHLARLIHMTPQAITTRLQQHPDKSFVYLKRGLPPVVAQQLRALAVPGVFTQREHRRFYPKAQVMAHVVGLADIDDRGQEGIELGMEASLRGQPGKKVVLKDRLGRMVADLEALKVPEQGQHVQLSIDHNLQFLAYTILQRSVDQYHAHSGSVVILDVKTGEVLAMANVPSYNPNQRPKQNDGRFRNRALTDVFEPGSTLKAMSIAAALETGRFHPDTLIDTHPGYLVLDGKKVHDAHDDLGVISLTQALKRSSNVAVAKMALSVPPQRMLALFKALGFGRRTQDVFPGEVSGHLPVLAQMRDIDVASLSFGYGVSVTALQLASAYATVANHGMKMPVTFLYRDHGVQGRQVISPKVADQVLAMLTTVVAPGGTGVNAKVPNYHVAGKTGTAEIAGPGGYDKHRHVASFVGVAPASDPCLVVAVVLHEPQGKRYFGSQVAAPAFAQIMAGALRLLNVTPDALQQDRLMPAALAW